MRTKFLVTALFYAYNTLSKIENAVTVLRSKG